MRNITVAISDESYRQARIWAAKNDTSISAAVGELLRNLPRLARVVSEYNADLYARISNPKAAPEQELSSQADGNAEPSNNQQLTPEESTVSQHL